MNSIEEKDVSKKVIDILMNKEVYFTNVMVMLLFSLRNHFINEHETDFIYNASFIFEVLLILVPTSFISANAIFKKGLAYKILGKVFSVVLIIFSLIAAIIGNLLLCFQNRLFNNSDNFFLTLISIPYTLFGLILFITGAFWIFVWIETKYLSNERL